MSDSVIEIRIKVTGEKAETIRAFLDGKIKEENRNGYPNAVVALIMEAAKTKEKNP